MGISERSHDGQSAPFFTSFIGLLSISGAYFLGQLRDLLSFGYNVFGRRKGYAPLRSSSEDFYNRRLYMRIHDCWNRPICSAPGSWIEVQERTDISYSSGFHTPHLQLTGKTRKCLNLASYNYLGFAASDEYCTPRALESLQAYGVSTCSSRAECGTLPVHSELEKLVADFLGKEASVILGMGFATNSVIIPSLVGKGCLILSDAINHASIAAGAKVSGAKVKVFRHNDAEHLEQVLRESIAEGQPRTHRPWKKVLIIVEGIYSMEGETCPLREIVEVKKKYKAYLYLDEAHSIGALGKTGRGLVEHAGVDPNDVDIMMGTFTKSFGSCGGYIAGSHALISHLKRHCPGHLYATAMAPAAAEQIVSALKLLMGHDGSDRGQQKVRQLHENANYMRERLSDMGLHILGDKNSPVIPVMIYHCIKMPVFSRLCLERHVAIVVVAFPATPLLLGRARLCISAAHTKQDLDYALEVIQSVSEIALIQYNKHALCL